MEINRNGRLILSNENSLLIAQIEQTDAGNYTCVASNIAGSYSSEPAELIVHGNEDLFCPIVADRVFFASVDDRGWSEWQPFSECKGIPCSTGRQRRLRTCLNPPTITNRPSCDGDQVQERECQMACPVDSPSNSDVAAPTGSTDRFVSSFVIRVSFVTETGFSDWSSWSDCRGTPCRIGHQQRMRTCVKLPNRDGKKSICNGEQVQERACSVACSNQNASSSSPSVRPFSKGNEGFRRVMVRSIDLFKVPIQIGLTGLCVDR